MCVLSCRAPYDPYRPLTPTDLTCDRASLASCLPSERTRLDVAPFIALKLRHQASVHLNHGISLLSYISWRNILNFATCFLCLCVHACGYRCVVPIETFSAHCTDLVVIATQMSCTLGCLLIRHAPLPPCALLLPAGPGAKKTLLGVAQHVFELFLFRRSEAIGDEVVSEIIAATERGPSNHDYGVGGHEAFTSIVFSPKVVATIFVVFVTSKRKETF